MRLSDAPERKRGDVVMDFSWYYNCRLKSNIKVYAPQINLNVRDYLLHFGRLFLIQHLHDLNIGHGVC